MFILQSKACSMAMAGQCQLTGLHSGAIKLQCSHSGSSRSPGSETLQQRWVSELQFQPEHLHCNFLAPQPKLTQALRFSAVGFLLQCRHILNVAVPPYLLQLMSPQRLQQMGFLPDCRPRAPSHCQLFRLNLQSREQSEKGRHLNNKAKRWSKILFLLIT